MSSTPCHGGHRALLAAVVLASALAAAGAQQAQGGDDAPGSGGQEQVSTAMVVLLAAVVAVFVFIAASTVYLRRCSGYAVGTGSTAGDGVRAVGVPSSSLDAFFASRSWWQRRRHTSRGLDAQVVEAFPTMTYAEAKALRVGTKGGGALECAVCLSEFEDGDRLRLLLPKCSHAFHPDCIGEWLAGHVTCPVCRCNLEPNNDKDTSSGDGEPTIPLASSISSDTAVAALQDAGPLPVAVVIDVVTEEEEEERRQEALELQWIGTHRRAMRSRSGIQPPPTAAKLARWHSTGHSHSLAARLDRDLERFTLRLPEHVRREMVAAAAAERRSSQSRRGRRRAAAEGGARSAPLAERLGSWQSLLGRTFSGKLSFFSASRVTTVGSGGGGEVSSSSSYSYARLRGKRVAAVDAAADVPAEESSCLGSIGVEGSGGPGGASAKATGEEVAAASDEKEVKKQLRT